MLVNSRLICRYPVTSPPVASLGGEFVGGETPWWLDDR